MCAHPVRFWEGRSPGNGRMRLVVMWGQSPAWRGRPGRLCSPALALSSLWFRVRLGLHPSCVSVPPEQSVQQQGQTRPEPPVTLTFHPGGGHSHAACPPRLS